MLILNPGFEFDLMETYWIEDGSAQKNGKRGLMGMPLHRGEAVKIVSYDPDWPREFERLREVIAKCLGELCLGIEHVGSTSIPGLIAKPIIDMDVVLISEREINPAGRALKTLGYFPEGEKGIPGRYAFGREDEKTPRDGSERIWQDHHLYICSRSNPELKRHIFVREFLRNNPRWRDEYARLKKESAEKFCHDRQGYSASKNEFFQQIFREGGIEY